MSKVIIKKAPEAQTGYALVIIDDEGKESVNNLDSLYKDGVSIKLPENPSNRKWIKTTAIKGDSMVLEYKESRTFGPRTKISAEEVLTPEEFKEYQDIKATFEEWETTIKERIKERQNKPLTELEKAQRAYEKALAKLEALRK